MSIISNPAALGLNMTDLGSASERLPNANAGSYQRDSFEPSDAIRSTPWMPPIAAGGGFEEPAGGTASSDSAGTANGSAFGNIIENVLKAISNLFSQLGASFGSDSASANPQQAFYSNARAGSTGDPHDSFNATTGAGSTVSQKWDDMHSHANLLSSDSFAGGFRIGTTVTQPNARGVTLNDSASITTDGGRTSVRMNHDGSYDVSSFGRSVALTEGQAVHLGTGESVTLNADRSLTVDERNAHDGSISTTLRSNGDGGVDIAATASNVDLGGFLARRSDAARGPVREPDSNDNLSLM